MLLIGKENTYIKSPDLYLLGSAGSEMSSRAFPAFLFEALLTAKSPRETIPMSFPSSTMGSLRIWY
jgi:hypothetical protein